MLKSYLKTAWRSLKKNKLFSGLNIFGLAIGMAGAILIAILLQHMMSYDRFYKDEDQLFIISNRGRYSGALQAWKNTPKVLGATLKSELPEIQAWTRFNGNSFLFTVGEKKIQNKEGAYVDPGFFTMFNFPMESGNANADWNAGKSIVVSAALAKALFGTTDAVGRSIKLDTSNYVKVSGVMADMPTNTGFKSDYLLSWEYARQLGFVDSSWGNNSVHTYIKLAKGVNLAAFNNKIQDFSHAHSEYITTQIFAEPLSRDYLYNKDENGQYVSGRIVLVRCLSVIGVLLLLIACINFMNLSTAQSERRAREVGVKKVIGATRKRLIFQFLVESVMLSLFAFLLAIGIVLLLLPAFGNLVEANIGWQFGWTGWLAAVAVMVITGLIAGSYPAFYLSSFAPIKVLKGTFNRARGSFNPRSVLVILQFTVAIILILTTIMITEDTRYVQRRDPGYDQDGVVFSSMQGHLQQNYIPLRDALLKSGAVSSVSRNMSPITQRYSDGWGMDWPGSTEEDKKTDFVRYSSDADMVKTMGMRLVKGRDIDIYKYPSDSTAMILTESAVKTMRLKQPIGSLVGDNGRKWHVVGVISDFIIEQPFDKIEPMVVEGPLSFYTTIHYRLNPAHSVEDNLATIKKIFDRFNPEYSFEYQFADDTYGAKFKEYKKFGQLSLLFAGLTIFISCLGLFGLITYMAETKTKEIGVRKVLGASVVGIIALLSKGFVRLIIISFIIAVPIAWYIMNRWLAGSVYSIGIHWWWFILTIIVAIAIAFITVSFQALKAAKANPVESLKTE